MNSKAFSFPVILSLIAISALGGAAWCWWAIYSPETERMVVPKVHILTSANVTNPENDWLAIGSDLSADITGWSIRSTISGKKFTIGTINGQDVVVGEDVAYFIHTVGPPAKSYHLESEYHQYFGEAANAWGKTKDTIELLDPNGAVADTYTYGQDVGETQSTSQLVAYEDPTLGYSFKMLPGGSVKPKTTDTYTSPGGEVFTSPLPKGTVEVPGVFVISKKLYTDFTKEKAIVNYESCCSGQRYWYDSAQNTWKAETIKVYSDTGGYLSPDQQFIPLSLASTEGCSVGQKFGSYTFYLFKSGDEAVADTYFYILPTDKGYALLFAAAFDIGADYSDWANALMRDQATQILSTLVLPEGVHALTPSCN